MQKLDNIYDHLLGMYKGNPAKGLDNVFLVKKTNLLLASNGYEVIRFERELYPTSIEAPEIPLPMLNMLEVSGAFSRNNYSTKTIQLSALIDALASTAPKYQQYCPSCKGSGSVEYHYEYSFREYTHTGICPICHSTGKVSTSIEVLAKVGINHFPIGRLQKLAQIAQLLNETTIELYFEHSKEMLSNFKIGNITVSIVHSSFFDDSTPILFELCT